MTLSKKQIGMMASGLAVIVLTLFWFFKQEDSSENMSSINELEEMVETKEEGRFPAEKKSRESQSASLSIVVDVKGAVQTPGVYEMKEGSRVKDAVMSAGGFIKEADINQVNLAGKLKDEMVIYIPKLGEMPALPAAPLQVEENAELVNINAASSEQLQSLPGIGPSKAEAIIAYREEKGGFQKAEDLMNVSGIGEKSFEKIKEHVTIQ
ncbi:helix-hairpin-helix domain-containing protein [Bacillus songklensis]|uniref:Helix-hairpin-helix domain-containing protein n=1 Tax=Bacillus songklensis TaxID=1069116 RepID=A0ABV8AYD1_9BACI